MQWSEWDVSAMPNGGFLPKTSQSPSYLGSYTGNFPNPIQSLSTPNMVYNNYMFGQYDDPETNAPGDIGKVGYYNTDPGPFKYTSVIQMDFWQMEQEWNSYKKNYADFNMIKMEYEKNKEDYNTAYMFNKLQKGDFFRSFLEKKMVVPDRPCKPTLPITFDGLLL